MIEFELEGREFIELNKLLKILRLVGTGGEANNYIVEGYIRVNNVIETQKRKKLRAGDRIEFEGYEIVIK